VKSLTESLAGQFVVVNLGSATDRDYELPADLLAATTLVEVDAAGSSHSKAKYFAKHILSSVVSGAKETRTFRVHRYGPCSSLLEPRRDLIEAYGLNKYYEPVSSSTVECERLPDLLKEIQIQTIDFLKTDLEGMDFAVIQTCEAMLPDIVAIQCELRFQPFYSGEPHFHEVVSYLVERNFELIGLQPEYWKPKTPHANAHKDGRAVWADCLFMRKPDTVRTPLHQAKQVIIASLAGRRCYGEHLLELYRTGLLPQSWAADLERLVLPKPNARRNWIRGALHHFRKGSQPQEFPLDHIAER
jgi:FkbM family methyltransferase